MKHISDNDNVRQKMPESKDTHFSFNQLLSIIDKVPVCINVLNEKAESVYCNAYTVKLYGLKSKRSFLTQFYNLTPEKQPDGRNSKLAFTEHVLTAIDKGETQFSWLDIKLTGEELPLDISIYRLNMKDEDGNELLVSTMRDLRPQLARDDDETIFDNYSYSRVTYKELFNSVAELTDEWFWIYDVKIAMIQFFGKGREILGLSADKKPFPSYVVDSGMVYPDDLETFLNFDENLKTGVVKPVEVRFVQPNGAFRYYGITYKTIYNKDGKPMFSIGKTYDIDKQKRLEVLSKTDLLTNCLNKVTTENVVKDILDSAPASSHALFLIDVDDFKSVNDELGHYFGDVTLSDIAKNLHANFRGADVIGRIGGDEFLVFVKNISDENVIRGKARSIADAFKTSYAGENGDYKISGSIGVSLYPQHATTYEDLYKCADKALYSSKTAGKDRYTIYSNALVDATTKKLTAVDNATNPVNAYFDADITSTAFDLIYQAEDVNKAMNTVVRLIGMHMNADRCYVAQTFNGGESYSITYEWGRSPKDEKKNAFQDIPLHMIRDFFAELEEHGLMYNNSPNHIKAMLTKDADSLENKNSYLLVQSKGKGHTRLIFGLDDSNEHRVWSEKEINTMQYVLKMLSIFLASSHIHNP